LYWEEKVETIKRDELENLQLKLLKDSLKRADTTPFYKKHFEENGFKPEDIKNLDDVDKIPFTTKDDLRKAYPYGMLAVSKDDVVRMHASSGTTGIPTVIYHTQKDLDNWTDIVARCLYMAGIRKSDVFQNMMTYGLFTGGLGLHYGAEKLGTMVIPASSGNTQKQIKFIQDFDVTVAHITPSYALHLADLLKLELKINPCDLGLKYIIYGGEPASEATRLKLEETFGLKAFNCYGLSEMNGPGVGFE
jgi:phenylacetate-CoA ligase